MWLNRVVTAVNKEVGLEKSSQQPRVPGKVVVSIDGSDKGGHSYVLAALRRRWSALGQSEHGCHPIAIAKIKEKDKLHRNYPLACFMAQLRYADLSVWEYSGVECITPPNTPRLRDLIADLDPDDVAFTTDLGFLYIVMNGPVTKSKPDLRVTKSFLARRRFCTMCAGEHDDSAILVSPDALVVVSEAFQHQFRRALPSWRARCC